MAAVAVVVVSTEDDDNTTCVPKPAPLTDEALDLQSRLWSVTYGSNIVARINVTVWVAALFAEYGQLLTSREPVLEWPHYELTRPQTNMWMPYQYGSKLRVPPLLWLLLLDAVGL